MGGLNQGPVITVRMASVGCGFESLEVACWAKKG